MPRAAKAQTPMLGGPRLVGKSARAPSTRTAPLQERIAIRAYELFLLEGAEHGRDVGHWLRAEQELVESEAPAHPAGRVAGSRAKA